MPKAQTRMPIGGKIALIGGSFFLPIAVLLYLMVGSMSSAIDFAHKELLGAAFLKPAMGFQAALGDYYEASAGCQPLAQCQAMRDAAKQNAENQLLALDAESSRSASELQFTPEGLRKRGRDGMDAAGLRVAWNELIRMDPNDKVALDRAYHRAATVTRALIVHAGDTSNLILDPDLDSYYLMDAVLVAAPQMQERLTSIVQAARGFGSSTGDSKTRLAVLAAMFGESDYGRLTASVATAINEDGNFYGASPTLKPKMEASIAAAGVPAGRLREAMSNGGDPASIAKLAAETRHAGYENWMVANQELERLLENRIADYQGQRSRAITVATLAVLAASLLAFLLLRSITGPLESLVRSLGPGATLLSGCVDKIAEVTQQQAPSPEETSIICDELNAHADDMRKAVIELARQVRGAGAEELADTASGHRV